MPMTFAVVTFDSFWSATRWTSVLLLVHMRVLFLMQRRAYVLLLVTRLHLLLPVLVG